jgi:uracil-DNA glycosylase family 4
VKSKKPLTLYQKYKEQWKNGCGHNLCERACHIVHLRGSVPCDIAFIGEAPGRSEDTLGSPFIGPAGHLLDHIIKNSIRVAEHPLRTAFMNMVGCLPRSDEDNTKLSEPSEDQVETCKPRLEHLLKVAKPKLIVAVGQFSAKHLEQGYMHSVQLPSSHKQVCVIDHPAFILRTNIANRGLMVQRAMVVLRGAIEDVWGTG